MKWLRDKLKEITSKADTLKVVDGKIELDKDNPEHKEWFKMEEVNKNKNSINL